MRLVRPFVEPDLAERRTWWEADVESIRADVASRLEEGRGSEGIVDPELMDDLREEGIID